ncbi:MAG: hypothetical protein ABN480_07055 [Dickeya sp.]|uniref:hypothetical protein n=1 Tax=Dickeya zeae TaxID=204042 RepID=UPI0005765BAF|nr:hypothetical protein [Dickeya zeae]
MTEKLMNFTYDESFCHHTQLESFQYSTDSLELIFSFGRNEERERVKVFFDWIYSFRVIDESDLLKMLEEQNGAMTTGIYYVEESKYLEWFNEQSGNIHENVVHYMFVTINDVIDVLSSVEPSMKIIK